MVLPPAQQVDDEDRLAAVRLEQVAAAPRSIGQDRIVGRADQARLADDVGQGLALVPAVVAQGQAVGASLEQLARRVLGDAEARGGVLGVDDHELEPETAAKIGQMVGQAVTARLADDIAEEGETHR
jgi:hypothetical protein